MAAPTPQRTPMSFILFNAPTMTRKATVRNGVVSCWAAFPPENCQTALRQFDPLGGNPTARMGWLRDWQLTEATS